MKPSNSPTAQRGARWPLPLPGAVPRAIGVAVLAGGLSLAAAPPAVAEPDAIVGVWQTLPTDKGFAHVEVLRRGESYEGRIVWLSEPDFPPGEPAAGEPKADILNPDPELRGQPILGMLLMSGFRYEDGVWKGGWIYDPETGKTYKCTMRLGDDGALRLRGFIGISLIGRTTVWSPVSS